MTKQEAITAMKAGCKVTHRYFTPQEWMKISGEYFVFEDGVEIEQTAFWHARNTIDWQDGYSVFNEK